MNATTNATTMNRTTDLEEIRKMALLWLEGDTKIPEHAIRKDYNLSHPFWYCRFIDCKECEKESGFLDIVGNPDDFRIAKAIKREKLVAATTPLQIFQELTENWDTLFLSYMPAVMSTDDLSEVLRYVWGNSEYAANTSHFTSQYALRLFRRCNPHILMSDAEYEVYQALPEELTVYRGVFRDNKQLIKSVSWTLDPEVVKLPPRWWGSLRFGSSTGKAYTAKIKKQDVLAYFERDSEVVVNPRKLYGIQSYYIKAES